MASNFLLRRHSTRRCRRTDQADARPLRLETLEARRLLSLTDVPISAAQRDLLLDGLNGLAAWAETLDDHDQLAQALPAIGHSMGGALDMGDVLAQGLAGPIADYFAADPTPTSDEFVAALVDLDGETFDNVVLSLANVSGGKSTAPGDNELIFSLELSADRSLLTEASLGPEGQALGIDFSTTIAADARLTFDATFGLDLTQGLAAEDAFFLRPANLAAEVDAAAPSLAAGPMSIGFYLGQLTSGNLSLDADLGISVNNPDLDAAGNITLAELQGTSLDTLVALSEAGTASGQVTIDPADLGSFSPTGSPTISFNTANPFLPPALSFNAAYDELHSFTNISAFDVLGVFDQLGNWLGGLRTSEALDAPVELAAAGRLGDLIALEELLQTGVADPLADPGGMPTFATAQGLAAELASVLGISTATVNPQYVPGTKELTYRLVIDESLPANSVPVGFALDLSPLSNLITQSTASLNAAGQFEFILGFRLDDLSAVMTSTATAPANGQITGDSNFALNLGLGNDVAVTLLQAATADNATRGDLVADLNSALFAAGLSGSVVAGLDSNDRLTFATVPGASAAAALELTAADYTSGGSPSTDPIVAELGFRGRQFAFDSLANHAFLEEATLDGQISLAAADIDGTAQAGFVRTTIESGTGVSTANFSLALKDPATQTPGGRVGLFELFDALAVDIFSVVDPPTLSGSLDVDLPLDGNILGSPLSTSPRLEIDWAAISSGSPSVVLVDGSELENFQHLSSGDFSGALGAVNAYFASLESHSMSAIEIPGLNQSLASLASFTEKFAEFLLALENNPAAALDDLEDWLELSLGLADENLDLSLVDEGDTIRTDLTFVDAYADQTPLAVEFPLVSGGEENNEILIGLSGSGLMNVDFDVDFQLSFGIDISSGGNFTPFLYESSHLAVMAEVNAQNIEFNANIGPLGLFIRNGELLVDADGNDATRDQAVFRIDLTDDDVQTSDGKILLDQIGFDNASAMLTGQVNLVLPMFYPFQSDFIGNLEFRIADLADPLNTTELIIPDLDEEEQEQEGGALDNLTSILNGLDGWFEIAIDAFNGKVGGVDLPFVGKDLNKVADFLEEVQQEVITQITDRFRETEGNTGAALQTALFLAVGPEGLNILKDRNASGTITIDDVLFTTEDADQDNKIEEVEFFLELGQDLTVLDTPIDFDIGLPGLGLDVEGDLEILVGYQWDLSFGVSNEYGFYLLSNEEDEIQIDLEVRIPDLKGRGELAILQLDVADEDADSNPNNDGVDVDQDGRDPSVFTAGLSVDFLDPVNDPEDPNDDGKVQETEIEQIFTGDIEVDNALSVELVGEALLNLDLLVSFEGDARLPSIGAEFTVHWMFTENNEPEEEDDLSGELPTVAFTNITLNAGELIADFADGVLKEIQKFTKPIQPVVDFVTSPLPILSDFGFDFSPLDIAAALGYATEAEYIEAVADLVSVINAIPEVSDDLKIPLGEFIIVQPGGAQTDLRDEGALESSMPEVTQAANPVMELKAADDEAGDFFDDLKAMGIELPILENPTTVFRLLMGQSVDLFLYDVPPLEVSFPFPIIKIGPIIPPIPLFASISGNIGARLDLAVGFDSHGIQKASETGDWWDVFNGFFISDTASPDGTGEDVVEAALFGNLNAAAELSLVVVGAGVSGGVDLMLTADLVDTNNDGKVHLDELIANIPLGVTGTFDLGGSITARLDAFVELLFKRTEFTIAQFEVASFEFTEEDIFTDRFSGNNTMASAEFLGAGPGLHIDGLSLETLGDVDWFEFELLHEDSIEVDIRHSSVHGDIDLQVYDASGQLVAEGSSGHDREFAELLDAAAGNYFVRVSGVAQLNNYQLAVEPGKSSDTRVFYVSPARALDRGDAYYASSPGDDKHDGQTHRKPKASLADLYEDYDLGPNDVVVLEKGVHAAGAVLTAADAGATYLGALSGATLSNFTLQEAHNNTFHRVHFASNSPGLSLLGADNNRIDLASFSGPDVNLVFDDSDNNLVARSSFSGTGDGIHFLGNGLDDSSGNLVIDSEFANTGTAIDYAAHGVNTLEENRFTGNGQVGVRLAEATPAVLTGNDIAGRQTGIRWNSRVANVWDNDIRGGDVGIETISGVVGPDNPAPFGAPGGLTPNRIHDNQTGVVIPETSVGAILRHTEIYSNTVGVDASGDQTQLIANDVRENDTGIRSSRVVGPSNWEINLSNQIHDNLVGVEALPGAEVRFNQIFANGIGVQATGAANVHHNLIYRNTGDGLLVSDAGNVDATNNTFYVPSGSGIRLEGASHDVDIRNNIVATIGGFGLVVEAESQFGYVSDYNNYHAAGAGGVAFQGKEFFDLYDWQVEAESDLHSLGTTVLDPTLDDPLFVDLSADDYRLQSGSTSIDAGDPSSPASLEPAPHGNRINLGAYGNTPQAAASPARRLEITRPNFYVDLVPSRTYEIGWETNNIALGVQLDIDLIEVGVGKVADIAATPVSAGSVQWTPGTFVAGDLAKRYRVRATTLSGAVVSDESREPFSIVDHDPAAANIFYVNDGSTADDVYTNAAGDNRNTGLAPDAPKAMLRPLVLSYAMDAGDAVRIDAGSYVHAVNLNLAGSPLQEDPRMNTVSATEITGPPNPAAADINRANPFAGAVAIDFVGSPSMSLADLTIVGAETGVRVRDGSTDFVGARVDLSNHSRDGLSIENGSDRGALEMLTVHDNLRHGVFVDSLLTQLVDSEVHHNGEIGVALRSVGAAEVLRNEIYQNRRGLDVINPGAATTLLGGLTLPVESGNQIYSNHEEGVFASGNVLVAGNTVYENANFGVRLDDGADATRNVVRQHAVGISARGSSSDVIENRSFVNSVTGIEASLESNLYRNVVYNNQLHGIDVDRFEGVIDHNLVYSTGAASIHVAGPGATAQLTHNTVYEPCVVDHDPTAPATVDTQWDMNVFMEQFGPPMHAFFAPLWGRGTFEFLDAVGDQGETFDLGPGGGTGALLPAPLPPGATWTIDYTLMSLDLSSAMEGPIPGVGIVEATLMEGPASTGQLVLENIDGTITGTNHLELWVEFFLTDSGTTLFSEGPVVIDASIGPSAGFSPVDVLQIPTRVLPGTSTSGFLININAPSDAWQWNLVDADVTDPPDPPPQDAGDTCAEIGVHIENNSHRVLLRQNAIYVQGDPAPEPGDPISVDIVVDATSTLRFDSDHNALITDYGAIGRFGGVGAASLVDWQNITGGDLHSLSPLVSDVWFDPDGDDNRLAGLASGDDDNFHLRSPFGQVDRGALAPLQDKTPGSTGLPQFEPVVWETTGGSIDDLSPLVDAAEPAADFSLESAEHGQFANIGVYGNTLQASRSEPEYVHLAYPIGAEQIVPGQTYEILWRSHDQMPADMVEIELVHDGSGGAVETVIDPAAANTGSYHWTVDPATTIDNDYAIVITRPSALSPGDEIEGVSPFLFEITGDSRPPRVLRSTPETIELGRSTNIDLSTITVEYSENVLGADDAANYALTGGGPNGVIDNVDGSDDVAYSLSVAYHAAASDGIPSEAVLTIVGGPLPENTYRLSVSSSVSDNAGNALDGAENGGANDYVRLFRIDKTAPSVSIPPILPNPRNADADPLSIEFDEPVVGFGLADVRLTRDGGPNLLSGDQRFASTDDMTWTLGDVAELTSVEGDYHFAIEAVDSEIADLAGNLLIQSVSTAWTVDRTPPTVDIVDISPDPRSTAVNQAAVVFSEPVTGFSLADLKLFRDGQEIGLPGASAPTTTDQLSWTIDGLSQVTAQAGSYLLKIVANGSVADAVGNPLVVEERESWQTLIGSPSVDIVDVTPDPRINAVDEIVVAFDRPVTGFDLGDVGLSRGGLPVSLAALPAPTSLDAMNWHVSGLAAVTSLSGEYVFELEAAGSGITDFAGNLLTSSAADAWTTDFVPPTVTLAEVNPDPRNVPVDSLTISFDKPIAGLDLDRLVLFRDAAVVPWQGTTELTTADHATWTLSNLANLTSIAGVYQLTLDPGAGQITANPGNPLVVGDAESWQHDPIAPTVAIRAPTPNPTFAPVDFIELAFSEPVSGLDLGDLILRRRGAIIPWAAEQTLATSDQQTWTLSNLASLSDLPGNYEISLPAFDADVVDAAGNALRVGDFTTWQVLIPGDTSGDNRVGLLDLGRLQRNLGTIGGATPYQGDLTDDGTVDREDLATLAGIYNTTLPPAPQPATYEDNAMNGAHANLTSTASPAPTLSDGPTETRSFDFDGPSVELSALERRYWIAMPHRADYRPARFARGSNLQRNATDAAAYDQALADDGAAALNLLTMKSTAGPRSDFRWARISDRGEQTTTDRAEIDQAEMDRALAEWQATSTLRSVRRVDGRPDWRMR